MTTGCNNWDSGLDIVVESPALQVADDVLLARLATAWSAKWDGRWRYEVRNGHFHHPGGSKALFYAVDPDQDPGLWERDFHGHDLPLPLGMPLVDEDVAAKRVRAGEVQLYPGR